MHDTTTLTLARIDRFLEEWIAPAVVRARHALDVTAWHVPDEPVPFAEARAAQYEPFAVGTPWGAAWSTTWFHVTGVVPRDWPVTGTRVELGIDLGFIEQMPGFQAEGAAWSPDGRLVKGVSPRNAWVPLPQEGGHAVDLYLEAAANPDVPGNQWTKPTVLGHKDTSPKDPIYTLRALDVVLRDETVEALLADARALRGLVDEIPVTSTRRAHLVAALEDMCDAVDPDDVAGTAAAGRDALAPALAAPSYATSHTVHAVGHAHIDSAWLWPVRETMRKVSRTVANVLALMDADPNVRFAFSSAQQYAWLEERYPELFERLRARVAEGRVVPVGGMWVESDTNMVGSEALVRQFVEGKGYFLDRFGIEPTSVWLPDSFGYTGAFPQVARLAGCTDFLTQKLSWNDTNRVPHHTFWWEGIDGTRVFTHFPPVDTYNSDLSAKELAHAESEFRDKARASHSLAPFGYGDGGGGPTREMVAQAHRTADLEGSPRVALSSPDEFFATARAEYAALAPSWVGELYLEYHRGTYTTQERTKRGNRRSEHLLREAELWATAATVRTGAAYPAEALQRLWRLVLLQQFHDILPGSSIAWVHREAERHYEEIAAEANSLIEAALAALGAPAGAVANASPFAHDGVAPLAIGAPVPAAHATLVRDGDGWVLRNAAATVRVDARGLVTSAVVGGGAGVGLGSEFGGREVVPAGSVANLLQLHRDIPNTWEAWDIDAHYRRDVTDLVEADVVEEAVSDDGAPALRVVRTFSGSRVEQLVWLAGGEDATLHVRTHVDWHEQQKLLKLAFPIDVHTDEATSQMQFGHVTRPIHANTSWDQARFETVAHRWVHVGEPGFGVALANDGTYGHDIAPLRVAGAGVSGGDGGRSAVCVRATLLRAPLFPDPVADQGEHTFHHALRLDADLDAANELGYALNLPARVVTAGAGSDAEGVAEVAPLVRVSGTQVVVESVKLARDGSGDVIVRLYEARGARARECVRLDFPHTGVVVTDLLERPLEGEGDVVSPVGAVGAVRMQEIDGGVGLDLRPFQVVTLRVAR